MTFFFLFTFFYIFFFNIIIGKASRPQNCKASCATDIRARQYNNYRVQLTIYNMYTIYV